ncbi:hypothetical protein QAD02_017801 [Eretmocerus hayati]|uniref:Uncharacterized protein n=1 Tax=Eretmocerus hayati TaxID=131215 RepID=A0ACC2PHF3_9HYME|nr:hypothetical protein QAD02_017801 [Eretmocerus hayati]
MELRSQANWDSASHLVVQNLTVQNSTIAPTSVRVVDESTKQTLEDGRVLGPVIEGSAIALRCESSKGRPVPEVEWYNGDTRLKSESSSRLEEHEIGTGSGTLNLVVARSELGATFTCKVSSLALAEPLKIDIKLDVHEQNKYHYKEVQIEQKAPKYQSITLYLIINEPSSSASQLKHYSSQLNSSHSPPSSSLLPVLSQALTETRILFFGGKLFQATPSVQVEKEKERRRGAEGNPSMERQQGIKRVSIRTLGQCQQQLTELRYASRLTFSLSCKLDLQCTFFTRIQAHMDRYTDVF